MRYSDKQAQRIMSLLSSCEGTKKNPYGLVGTIRFDFKEDRDRCEFEYSLVYSDTDPETGEEFDINTTLSAELDFRTHYFMSKFDCFVDMDSDSQVYKDYVSEFDTKKQQTSRNKISEIFSKLYVGESDFIDYQNVSYIGECFNKFIDYIKTIEAEDDKQQKENWLFDLVRKVRRSYSILFLVDDGANLQDILISPEVYDRIRIQTSNYKNLITIVVNNDLDYVFRISIGAKYEDGDPRRYVGPDVVIKSKEQFDSFIRNSINSLRDRGFEKYADYLEELI